LWMGPEKHFVAYPVSSGRLMNFVGVVPAQAGDVESWSADGDAQDLRREFEHWDPKVLEMITNSLTVKRWALMHRSPLPRLVEGPVVVLGDAAHPMLPHLAQGSCQAIEDAVHLAAVLSEKSAVPLISRLQSYQKSRLPRASKIQAISQLQGEEYHLADGAEQIERDARLTADGISEQAWLYDFDASRLAHHGS
jgi:salicylate hydroxylase